MNRLRTHPFVTLPLAILVAAAVLWARNTGGGDAVVLFLPGGHVSGLLSSKGQLILVVTNAILDDRRPWTVEVVRLPDDQVQELRGELLYEAGVPTFRTRLLAWHGEYGGFAIGVGNREAFGLPGVWHRAIAVPFWPIIAIAAVGPVRFFLRRRMRRRRSARGRCVECGYDLRGSADDRCPECGMIIPLRPPSPTQARQPAPGA